MKEKIIQISYAEGETNPTILTSFGRILRALPINQTQLTPYIIMDDDKSKIKYTETQIYKYFDLTPLLDLITFQNPE